MQGSIIIITDNSPRHGYFVKKLFEAGLPVQGVITGAKRHLKRHADTLPPTYSKMEKLALREVKNQRRKAENRFFGQENDVFDRHPSSYWHDHVHLADGDINNARFVDIISNSAPKIVAVMGATIIKPQLLDLPSAFISMHTGLSPYYRGGKSNMWPILEGDFGLFGVTIHSLAPGIDNGNILASKRVLVEPGDDYPTINARSIIEGVKLMGKVLAYHLSHPQWLGTEQWSRGKLFHDRNYTPLIAQRYLDTLPSYIDEHLKRQKAHKLDAIRTVELPK